MTADESNMIRRGIFLCLAHGPHDTIQNIFDFCRGYCHRVVPHLLKKDVADQLAHLVGIGALAKEGDYYRIA